MKLWHLGVIVSLVLIAWGVNIVRFINCDFESPYKCEIVHGIGLVPPIAPFVVWTDTDDK